MLALFEKTSAIELLFVAAVLLFIVTIVVRLVRDPGSIGQAFIADGLFCVATGLLIAEFVVPTFRVALAMAQHGGDESMLIPLLKKYFNNEPLSVAIAAGVLGVVYVTVTHFIERLK